MNPPSISFVLLSDVCICRGGRVLYGSITSLDLVCKSLKRTCPKLLLLQVPASTETSILSLSYESDRSAPVIKTTHRDTCRFVFSPPDPPLPPILPLCLDHCPLSRDPQATVRPPTDNPPHRSEVDPVPTVRVELFRSASESVVRYVSRCGRFTNARHAGIQTGVGNSVGIFAQELDVPNAHCKHTYTVLQDR